MGIRNWLKTTRETLLTRRDKSIAAGGAAGVPAPDVAVASQDVASSTPS